MISSASQWSRNVPTPLRRQCGSILRTTYRETDRVEQLMPRASWKAEADPADRGGHVFTRIRFVINVQQAPQLFSRFLARALPEPTPRETKAAGSQSPSHPLRPPAFTARRQTALSAYLLRWTLRRNGQKKAGVDLSRTSTPGVAWTYPPLSHFRDTCCRCCLVYCPAHPTSIQSTIEVLVADCTR